MDTLPEEDTNLSRAALRDAELRIIAMLGCPLKVRQGIPVYQVLVTVPPPIGKENSPQPIISCKLIFSCFTDYPSNPPHVQIRGKRNFPRRLESVIYAEFDRIRRVYSAQHIMPMVSSALYIIECEQMRISAAAQLVGTSVG
ncbi:maker34 [Drosophila busckii]|uniref:Maker34 n=1 Tax=Drosophila busckii TaxID=30019 RepID=A0A0M4EFJ1_DROBS|nr:uncharacterized protein LOC108595887 [Drosophila busckii]ALC40985.1 maker34 [Drosophila busckii]